LTLVEGYRLKVAYVQGKHLPGRYPQLANFCLHRIPFPMSTRGHLFLPLPLPLSLCLCTCKERVGVARRGRTTFQMMTGELSIRGFNKWYLYPENEHTLNGEVNMTSGPSYVETLEVAVQGTGGRGGKRQHLTA
jgi:hypothetical protein